MLKFGAGFVTGFVAGFAALFALFVIFGDYEEPTVAQSVAELNIQVATTALPDSSFSTPNVAAIISSSGPSYEAVCDADERNMTDPQIKAFAEQWIGQRFSGWQGWVYDVVDYGDGEYDLQLAMEERGMFWGRNIVIENIPDDLATTLNVEQQVTLSGRIDQVETSFDVVCNPVYVTDFIVTLGDGTQFEATTPSQTIANTPSPIEVPSTPTPLPTWTPVPPPMNTDVIVDGIRWRAVGVQEIGNVLESNDEYTENATTQGKFVRVMMEVETKRNEPTTDYEPPDLVDAQGRRYTAYSERFYYLPREESCYAETFNPSLTRKCTEVYEVAADAAGIFKIIVNNFESYEPIEGTIELR